MDFVTHEFTVQTLLPAPPLYADSFNLEIVAIFQDSTILFYGETLRYHKWFNDDELKLKCVKLND